MHVMRLTLIAVWVCVAVGCARGRESVSTGDARVDALLARMSLEEKVSMIHGMPESTATDQGEAGYIPGVPRLGIPPLRLADGPPGVLTRYPATALTATMGLAATFSRADAVSNGVVIGREARALGIDVVLEPYINMHRDQTFARAYNTYGEDPLLTGQIAAALIGGVQSQGVMAQAKHDIAYDGAHDVSVAPQPLHEIYLAPFAAAVTARVASIMCSYNRVNGLYACGNAEVLNSILRGELGFAGFVTSDWGAVHDTTFINDGLDLEMPGGGTVMSSYFQARLPDPNTPLLRLTGPVANAIPEEPPGAMQDIRDTSAKPIGMLQAVHSGLVSSATITRAAGRILYEMDRFGLLDTPRQQRHAEPIDADEAIVRRTSQEAAVLLKNDAAALPLTSADLASLAMIGPGAAQTIAVGDAGEKALGHWERQVSTLTALRAAAGASAKIRYAPADDMTGVPVPPANLGHTTQPGLVRTDASKGTPAVDAQLNFTTAGGNALPAGSKMQWQGLLRIPQAGVYRLYLQVLGASAFMSIDGQRLADTGPLQLHGNILQPGQDNVLPTSDGLDNVRRELMLTAGTHTLSVQAEGDASGQPVQVRLNWVTPQQRRADYAAAIQMARHATKAVVFAWGRGRPAFHLPGDQDRLIADIAAVNSNTVVVLNISGERLARRGGSGRTFAIYLACGAGAERGQ
jgi:beta-glucosidase